MWITSKDQLEQLATKDRLRKLLIRYRGPTEGRFTCTAQDADHMIEMLTRSDCYVRDIEVLP
jgi:hypothetical protein